MFLGLPGSISRVQEPQVFGGDSLNSGDIRPSLQEVLPDGAGVACPATGWPEAGPSLGTAGTPRPRSGSSVSPSQSLADKKGSKLVPWIGDI